MDDDWKPLRVFVSGKAREVVRFLAYWAQQVEGLRRLCEDPEAKQRLLRAVRAATGEPEPDPPQPQTNVKQKRWLYGGKG